jgi:hypothetical protein
VELFRYFLNLGPGRRDLDEQVVIRGPQGPFAATLMEVRLVDRNLVFRYCTGDGFEGDANEEDIPGISRLLLREMNPEKF